jgi:hypothetical protein
VVLRDKKVSTSYVQRRLQVGYNKAASLIERMEKEGLISSPPTPPASARSWCPATAPGCDWTVAPKLACFANSRGGCIDRTDRKSALRFWTQHSRMNHDLGPLKLRPAPFWALVFWLRCCGSTALAAKPTNFTQPEQAEVNQSMPFRAFINSFKTHSGRIHPDQPKGNMSQRACCIMFSKPGKMRFEYARPSPFLIVSPMANG